MKFLVLAFILLIATPAFAQVIQPGVRTLVHSYSVAPDQGVAYQVDGSPAPVVTELFAPCCYRSMTFTLPTAIWEFRLDGLPELGRTGTIYVTLTGASASAILFTDVMTSLRVTTSPTVTPSPSRPTDPGGVILR